MAAELSRRRGDLEGLSVRVVSLVPSATETLIAWGIHPVAVTRFCEQPPRYRTVGGTKDPDIDAIVGLAPDLVVVCDQENRLPDVEALAAAGVQTHALHITALSHVESQMGALAQAVGLDPAVVRRCEPSMTHRSVRAFVPIWKRPWMTLNADTYAMSMLASLGVTGIVDDHDDRYPTLDFDAIVDCAPDVVLAPSEPYPFGERHRRELERIAPVRFVDGRDLFWWGDRTPDAWWRLDRVLAEVRDP